MLGEFTRSVKIKSLLSTHFVKQKVLK